MHPRLLGSFRTSIATALVFLCGSAQTATQVREEGEVLLVRDGSRTRYGAVRIRAVTPEAGAVVFEWHLPPQGVHDFGDPRVEKGVVRLEEVRGRALLAFGPFVLEWHTGAGKRGILSANGRLGLNPIFMATSAIRDPSLIRDVRSGYRYEQATIREAPPSLLSYEAFSDLPRARIGVAVEDTLAKGEQGVDVPAVRIARVDLDSNAFKAGVRRDQILIAFDAVTISSSTQFHEFLRQVIPGEEVSLTVLEKEGGEVNDYYFAAEPRLPPDEPSPKETPDPNLTAEEKDLRKKNEAIRRAMRETLEAIRATQFD